MADLSLDPATSSSFEKICLDSRAVSATIQVGGAIIASEIQTERAGIPDHSEEVLRLCHASRLKKRDLQSGTFRFPESVLLIALYGELSFVLCLRELEGPETPFTRAMEKFLAQHEVEIKLFAEALKSQQAYNEKVMLITQSIRLKSTDYYYDDSSFTREDVALWEHFRVKLKTLLQATMSESQAERLIERTLRKHRIPSGPKVRDIGKVSAEMIQQIPHRVRRRDLLASLQALLISEALIEENENVLPF